MVNRIVLMAVVLVLAFTARVSAKSALAMTGPEFGPIGVSTSIGPHFDPFGLSSSKSLVGSAGSAGFGPHIDPFGATPIDPFVVAVTGLDFARRSTAASLDAGCSPGGTSLHSDRAGLK